MGRIKTQLIKRTTNKLLSEHKEEFKKDFNENKKLVEKLGVKNKKIRNAVSGYITRLLKTKEEL